MSKGTTEAEFLLTSENRTARAFAAAGDGLKKLQKQNENFNKTIGGMKMLMGGGILGGFARSVISAGDEIGDLAERTGLGVESIQSLKIVANDAGIRLDRLVGTLNGLEGKMNDALVEGGEKSAEAFAKLGVNIEMLKAGNVEQVFEQIARAMGEGAGNADLMAAAQDILGSGVQKLGPIFKAAAGGLGELNAEMKRNGEIMSESEVAKLSKADRTLAKTGNQIKVGAAGLVEDVSSGLSAWKVGLTNEKGDFSFGRTASLVSALMGGFDNEGILEQMMNAEQDSINPRSQLKPFRPVVPPLLRPETPGVQDDPAITVLDRINANIEKQNQLLARNLGPVVGS